MKYLDGLGGDDADQGGRCTGVAVPMFVEVLIPLLVVVVALGNSGAAQG